MKATVGPKPKAAGVLQSLSVNAGMRITIAAAGGMQVLVDVVCDGNREAKAKATGALWDLSRNNDMRIAFAGTG